MPADFTQKILNISSSLQNNKSYFSLEIKFKRFVGSSNLVPHLKLFIMCSLGYQIQRGQTRVANTKLNHKSVSIPLVVIFHHL